MPDRIPTLTREFCAENMTHVPRAIQAGAARIELCDNLAQSGTTPSAGVIRACVRRAHAGNARVMVMIRPRGGDFCYAEEELLSMEADIALAASLGVDGVVFGCLRPLDEPLHAAARESALVAGALPGAGPLAYTAGFELDTDATQRLAALAHQLGIADVTFHMAFDELDEKSQLRAIDTLAGMGVSRILTHGGVAGTPIEESYPRLHRLIDHAAGRLTILPGGGITYRNAESVADELGVSEVHGTKIVDLASGSGSPAATPDAHENHREVSAHGSISSARL
ncbi:CutC-like protein [Collinsella sp. AK_207A]|uniref:copper homeostasis protein CutC n=1 Tax=Collinsella sp. AK_207A TaxID=2650472 RepID=UPI0012604374|nr:copper homeostasis protein CutC [Collinsella sp. AK_207A]VWL90395.1 CutC-like protein [Collinsella sp. AK_207A]